MKLVILESPNKTRTVSQYLDDNEYLVLSSNGHITELAKDGKYRLGVDLSTFKPTFVIDPQKALLLKTLKKYAKQAKVVYLATDPDREGEAISFHLANNLACPDKIKRVFFNEVTKKAVLKAFQHPTKIDLNLVESQITRRILDRMLGFRLSGLLQRKIKAKSAGRVQSVALKLIVERQKEIDVFVPEKTWLLSVQTKDGFLLKLIKKITAVKKGNKAKKNIIRSQAEFDKITKSLSLHSKVTNIEKKIQLRSQPLPLKTATLVQLASSQFNFSIKKTMMIAQRLYEGVQIGNKLVGLISYPRTDSQRVSEEFREQMSAFIIEKYGKEFVAKTSSNLKPKRKREINIQDAHEAIHITGEVMDLNVAKKFIQPDFYKIYQLIYNYSIASVMSEAQFKINKFILVNNDYQLEFVCENVVFLGFLKILKLNLENVENVIPKWKKNDKVTTDKINQEIKISKPKPMFSEGSLIKELEKLGIGRPSTYSTIISKLIFNSYISKQKNKLLPSEIGILVNKKLENNFADLINEKYTSQLEKNLDKIAKGKENRINFLNKFWNWFESKIKLAEKNMEKDNGKILDDKFCPKCNSNLEVKRGSYGEFIACSGYPECRFIEKKPQQTEEVGRDCEKCQKPLVQKQGRYGKFIACSGYPECRFIEKKPQQTEEVGRECKKCQKPLVQKQGRYGKFIACSGYPECRFIEKN